MKEQLRRVALLSSFVLPLLAWPLLVAAESPVERFTQIVEQLKQNPDDDALREKVIRSSLELRPSPEIPEDARRNLARGVAAFETAKGADDYSAAAIEFSKAMNLAPWWADPYFNRAIVLEKAGYPKEAAREIKWYLLAAPNAPDAEKMRTKRYKLEYLGEQQDKESQGREQRQIWAKGAKEQIESTYGARAERIWCEINNAAPRDNPDAGRWMGLGNSHNMDAFDPDVRSDNLRFTFSLAGKDLDQLRAVVPWAKLPICLDYDHRDADAAQVFHFNYCGDKPEAFADKEALVRLSTTNNGKPWVQVLYDCKNSACTAFRFRLEQ